MSHLTEQDRCKIENMLNAHVSARAIAQQLNRAHSTILREIKKHRKSDSDAKRKKNYCIRRKDCFRNDLCPVPPSDCPGRCSHCKILNCQEKCSENMEYTCQRLLSAPFVCNGCLKINGCQKRKYFYTAHSAMTEYRTTLHECRQGIDVSEMEISLYNELIKQGGFNGQSLHHIMTAHKDMFQKCEKTLYNYFNKDLFSMCFIFLV